MSEFGNGVNSLWGEKCCWDLGCSSPSTFEGYGNERMIGNDRSETDTSAEHTEPQQMVANRFNICMERVSITERLDSWAEYVYMKDLYIFYSFFLHTFQ